MGMLMEKVTNHGRLTVLIDDPDWELVKHFCITCSRDRKNGQWYARIAWRDGGKSPKSYELGRYILGLKRGDRLECEHIDPRATLDYRRSNLRIATRAQNNANRRLRKDNTSGYKGVSECSSGWKAQIMVDKKAHVLGICPTREEAYELYCKAAQELHGEFARPEVRST